MTIQHVVNINRKSQVVALPEPLEQKGSYVVHASVNAAKQHTLGVKTMILYKETSEVEVFFTEQVKYKTDILLHVVKI